MSSQRKPCQSGTTHSKHTVRPAGRQYGEPFTSSCSVSVQYLIHQFDRRNGRPHVQTFLDDAVMSKSCGSKRSLVIAYSVFQLPVSTAGCRARAPRCVVIAPARFASLWTHKSAEIQKIRHQRNAHHMHCHHTRHHTVQAVLKHHLFVSER